MPRWACRVAQVYKAQMNTGVHCFPLGVARMYLHFISNGATVSSKAAGSPKLALRKATQ